MGEVIEVPEHIEPTGTNFIDEMSKLREHNHILMIYWSEWNRFIRVSWAPLDCLRRTHCNAVGRPGVRLLLPQLMRALFTKCFIIWDSSTLRHSRATITPPACRWSRDR